jgi:hypothetical protein
MQASTVIGLSHVWFVLYTAARVEHYHGAKMISRTEVVGIYNRDGGKPITMSEPPNALFAGG